LLSIDLKRTIANFLDASDNFSALLEAVAKIAKYQDDTTPYVLELSLGGDKLNAAASAIHSRYASLQAVTREITPQKVYRAAGAFRNAVIEELDIAVRQHGFTEALTYEVDEFISRYDNYLMEPNLQTAAALMLQASRTDRRLDSLFGAFRLFDSALETEVEADVDETAISLVLSEVDGFEDFARKLEAFHSLYRELCFVLGTTAGSHPLKVAKIESGSLWIKVFGDTRVVQLLVALLESTVGYLHRTFTSEGKIASVPRKLESLDAAIQISAKLQSAGVDTSEMNENLRKSGVAISRGLAELLEDQPRVRVNRNVFTVGVQIEPLLLAQRTALRLADQSRRVEPTLDDQDASPPSGAA
jgi:hypothetical protein